MTVPNPFHLASEARSYATRGWHVLPVHSASAGRCSCGDENCVSTGKHPIGRLVPHGWKDASNDPDVVARWWCEVPDANIGIATEASSLVVLDNDPRHGGDESVAELVRKLGGPFTTAHARTGGGGDHFYFLSNGCRIKSRPLPGYSGIDVKAAAGYVVAPGSVHVSGRRYVWDGPNDPQPLPDALKAILLAEPARESIGVAAAAGADVITEGNRNASLTSLAGKLRHAGLSAPAIHAALQVANRERCAPPLTDAEVSRVADSIALYAPGADAAIKPRAVLLSELDLAARPALPDLIVGMMPTVGVGALIGAPESYKTFLQIELGLSVASGRSFFGVDVLSPGPAVLVAGEGLGRLSSRVAAWKLAHDVSLEASLGMQVFPEPVQLGDGRSVDHLIRLCASVKPRLVMLDTLARCSTGLDENSARDMGVIVEALDSIKRALSCFVMVAHHITKQGSTERGSGALRGAMDVMWRLERASSHRPSATLTSDKAKDGVYFHPIRLILEPVADSAVLRPAAERGATPSSVSERQAYEQLRNRFGPGGATAAEWLAVMSSMAERTFYRVIKTLEKGGYVRKQGKRYFAASAEDCPAQAVFATARQWQ